MKNIKLLVLSLALVCMGSVLSVGHLHGERNVAYAAKNLGDSARIEWGITNQDLKSTDGIVYPAGQEVARFTRLDQKPTGPYYLKLKVEVVFGLANGEIPEKYVTSKETKVVKLDSSGYTATDTDIYSEAGAYNPLIPVKEEIKPEGDYIKDGRYVTISNKNYNTWSNFGWKYRQSGTELLNKTFHSRGKYKHQNGSTYLSIFDKSGKWYGYISEKAVKVGSGKQGAYISDGRYVTAVGTNYNTWSNFDWKYRQSSTQVNNKTYIAKGRYHHFSGAIYLSIYDTEGNWHGYVNEKAVKIGSGKQGAYVSDGRSVKVIKKNYDLWNSFSWKKRQSSNQIVNKTFTARGKYYHTNGQTYYSLYDNKGNWQGYINSTGVK